ncbi:hypothetical protein B1NLA3E_04835 [Bacillus sp. 1NLA3E]|nr:hypothetical protein B1NLA3E_04835 [Bacillus sp. 1NLA3E]
MKKDSLTVFLFTEEIFLLKRKKPYSLGLQGFFCYFTNKGDGRNFFTVKQRGICLLVINFMLKIYHETNTPSIGVSLISQDCQKLRMNLSQPHKFIRKAEGPLRLNLIIINYGGVAKLRKLTVSILVVFISFAFGYNLLGLMGLVPLLLSCPLLFLSLFLLLAYINDRKKFRGF